MSLLTFVMPIRHQSTVADWPGVKTMIEQTMRSVAGQRDRRWSCVMVANEGADLPAAPTAGFQVVRVDFEPARLPSEKADRQGFYQAVRSDKGRRILAGLVEARPTGHVMVLDYDDFVSNRLAETIASDPGGNGWYVETGYVYGGGRLLHRQRRFYDICGSSFIVRADLLRIPETFEAAEEGYIQRTLGSHKFIIPDLERAGTPLRRLPYPGAIYRVGTGVNTSGTGSVVKKALLRKALLKDPVRLASSLASFRLMTPAIRDEFFGG